MKAVNKIGVLRKNKQFQIVYRYGRSYATRLAVLYVLPQPLKKAGCKRIGFVTGKKLGGAVSRNRGKRLLREAYRQTKDRVKDGVDLVLIGRPPIVKSQCQSVKKALQDLFRRAQLLTEEKELSCRE